MVGVFYCPTDDAARDPDEVVRQDLLRCSDAVANPQSCWARAVQISPVAKVHGESALHISRNLFYILQNFNK
jgi:hypothetical protein